MEADARARARRRHRRRMDRRRSSARAHGRYTPPILETSVAVGALKVPMAPRKIRIALGKAGLDGHINAVKLLAHACMQAGMEVVLAGFKQTPGANGRDRACRRTSTCSRFRASPART